MGYAYRIREQNAIHFLTFTVEQWVDVFSRCDYVDIVLDSLRFCQQQKGLQIYSWCIMTNHMHLIARAAPPHRLSDTIRDFKKFTSRKIVEAIESNERESRKNWLLWLLKRQQAEGGSSIEFWRDDNHAEEIYSLDFFLQKMEYIHMNPVQAGYVIVPEDWRWSSAGDFYGRKGLIELAHWHE